MNDQPPEQQEPKPTIDDALMDPELIRFPRIKYDEYPHHAVLRPQWLKSYSKYPLWIHHCGHWHWMTKPLEYAGEIASPELGLHEYVEQADISAEFRPETMVPINPPGEIYVTVNTVGEPTPLGMFPSVKTAMAAIEEFWLANRFRIWEIRHVYPEVMIEAPDWRRNVRDLKYPPTHPMREQIEMWMANIQIRTPIVRTRFGSFAIYQPEAVSFHENPEYPGNDMLRLSDKNGDHMVSIAIDAVTEVDVETLAPKPTDPESTFEAVADLSLPPMH